MGGPYAYRGAAVEFERVVPIKFRMTVPAVIALTAFGLIAARPRASIPGDFQSTQSCNTNCQEKQKDCALKSDVDAPCIQRCRAAAEDCVKKCASKPSDGGIPVPIDGGMKDR